MSAKLITIARRSVPFYFTVQCQHTQFTEWISSLTLCFAPLIAHIFVGAPTPVVLAEDPPGWHKRMLLFNPTTIYWRYYAITLRRASAQNWREYETAATNAVFWIGNKWDGSENIMRESEHWLLEKPHRQISLASAFKTSIVTLQGIGAAVSLAKGLSLGRYALMVALPDIFLPLAIAGLFRLSASPWLTDDYHYNTDLWKAKLREEGRLGQASLPEQGCSEKQPTSTSLLGPKSWLVIGVKAVFLIPMLALTVLAGYYFKPNPRVTAGTLSTLLTNILYMIFLVVTIVTTLVYTIRRRTNNTAIPCINSTWYMLYTYLLFSFAFVLVILTALQTRKTYCGRLTTYPADLKVDPWLCTDPFASNSAT